MQKENEPVNSENEDILNNQNTIQSERQPSEVPHDIPNLGLNSNEFLSLSNDNNEEDNTNNRCFEANLDGIYTNISKMISLEKKKIQKEKEYVLKTTKDFNDYKAQEIVKLEKEKALLRDKYKLNNLAKENDIIDLNIGGTDCITTKRSTLIKVKFSF